MYKSWKLQACMFWGKHIFEYTSSYFSYTFAHLEARMTFGFEIS